MRDRRWKLTIPIKQYLGEDDSPEGCKTAGAQIIAEIRKVVPIGSDPVLDEVLDELLRADRSRWFNSSIDALYDWADGERVWLG